MAQNAPLNLGEHTCCGVVQEAKYNAREKRRQQQAKPWIVLKLALIIAVGTILYASYVYIGRFCVPMLRRDLNALGSRTYGIAFLVVYSLLLIMTLWCYAKVALTSPGFAKDYVATSSPPVMQALGPDIELGGIPYKYQSPINVPEVAHPPPLSSSKPQGATSHKSNNTSRIKAAITKPKKYKGPYYSRRPPTIPALSPGYRYCMRESIVKPLRTHHCRACGKCILKYDHHCPWIGQCVGARNHKFFINFVQWTFLFCAWMFATLITLNVKPKPVLSTSTVTHIDPQHIVIMTLSGFFGFFTGSMLITHVRLISLNLSTLEHDKIVRMKDLEASALSHMFSWWQFREKGKTKREWDKEWGDLSTEGNIWWLGGSRRNWESVMGKSIWQWFLPIGRSESDGLDYPINPRFDSDGTWRRRSEWPEELR